MCLLVFVVGSKRDRKAVKSQAGYTLYPPIIIVMDDGKTSVWRNRQQGSFPNILQVLRLLANLSPTFPCYTNYTRVEWSALLEYLSLVSSVCVNPMDSGRTICKTTSTRSSGDEIEGSMPHIQHVTPKAG